MVALVSPNEPNFPRRSSPLRIRQGRGENRRACKKIVKKNLGVDFVLRPDKSRLLRLNLREIFLACGVSFVLRSPEFPPHKIN
jgi:hypothetical protein